MRYCDCCGSKLGIFDDTLCPDCDKKLESLYRVPKDYRAVPMLKATAKATTAA